MSRVSAPGLDQILALYDDHRWRECAAACQSAIGGHHHASVSEWYVIRTILAGAVVKLEGSPDFHDLISAAIQGMEQIVDSNDLTPLDERRGLAYRTLGYLHSKRKQGSIVDNRRRSVECYAKAVSILRPDREAQEWAEATLALGTQLLERARMLTKTQIARNADEMASARESVTAAISEFERALTVYTEERYPEERQTAVELIAAAHEILDILNREERSLH